METKIIVAKIVVDGIEQYPMYVAADAKSISDGIYAMLDGSLFEDGIEYAKDVATIALESVDREWFDSLEPWEL